MLLPGEPDQPTDEKYCKRVNYSLAGRTYVDALLRGYVENGTGRPQGAASRVRARAVAAADGDQRHRACHRVVGAIEPPTEGRSINTSATFVHQALPELTLWTVVTGMEVGALLTPCNVYSGLKIG